MVSRLRLYVDVMSPKIRGSGTKRQVDQFVWLGTWMDLCGSTRGWASGCRPKAEIAGLMIRAHLSIEFPFLRSAMKKTHEKPV